MPTWGFSTFHALPAGAGYVVAILSMVAAAVVEIVRLQVSPMVWGRALGGGQSDE